MFHSRFMRFQSGWKPVLCVFYAFHFHVFWNAFHWNLTETFLKGFNKIFLKPFETFHFGTFWNLINPLLKRFMYTALKPFRNVSNSELLKPITHPSETFHVHCFETILKRFNFRHFETHWTPFWNASYSLLWNHFQTLNFVEAAGL